MILVDANVLVRLCNSNDPLCMTAEKATKSLLQRGKVLVVIPQVLYEFWVVATRGGGGNGMGYSPAAALQWIEHFKKTFLFVDDVPGIYAEWERLVTAAGAMGKPAHDARIVAAMRLAGVGDVLTFNTGDFKRYGMVVTDPRDL